MATYPADLRYTREHEWAKVDGARARVGITQYAQDQLGDVVFVELPKVGTRVRQMQTFGVVESVKAVSDLFAPLSGEVVEVNPGLAEHPEQVNRDPYGNGWLIVIALSDPQEVGALLSAADYEAFLQTAGGSSGH
jgi:glycine cleavage system H protein